MGSNCGEIVIGLSNVYFEGKKVVCVMDLVKCDYYFGVLQVFVDGSKIVFVNGLLLVWIGYEIYCSGKVNLGCNSIWIDKMIGNYGLKNLELFVMQEFLVGLIGGIVGGGVGKVGGKGLQVVCEKFWFEFI